MRKHLESIYPNGCEAFKQYPEQFTIQCHFDIDTYLAYARVEGDYSKVCFITIELIENDLFEESVKVHDLKRLDICGFPFHVVDYDHSGILVCRLGEK